MRIQSGITGGGVDFDTLYRANRSMLVRLIRLAGATEDEADDAVQAAFAALLQVSYPVRDPLAWLHRTALNDFRCSNADFRVQHDHAVVSRVVQTVETARPRVSRGKDHRQVNGRSRG
jgi:hypothetical protein